MSGREDFGFLVVLGISDADLAAGEQEQCGSCHACPGEHQALMILCVTCGNKRCPKANDHNQTCTNSNAPGQKGSAYP